MTFLLVLIFVAAFFWGLSWIMRARVQAAAVKLDERLRKVYAPRHEYREVRPEEFPHLDLAWYDRMAEGLRARGFRGKGDLEDLTVSAAFPETRTFIRVMTAEDDTLSAGFYQARVTGPTLKMIQARGMDSLRVLDLQTEFEDGRFVSTTNAEMSASIQVPAEIIREVHPAETSADELLQRHRVRLDRFRQGNPGVEAVPMSGMAALIASANRQNALRAAHREGQGGFVTREEIRRIARASDQQTAGEILADEMEKLHKK
ncbi:MAG: hypothetical protein KA419_03940 [Acidobacteria bacterium]|nr:hypothetical protein [Acidobacteriota bacterium]